MFCPKCGKEINSGTKFCSGCGNPIEIPAAAPAAESAPYVRSTIETPVSDTPVYIPEPAKAKSNKKYISIAVIIAMITTIVFGYLTIRDFDGEWKVSKATYNGESLSLKGQEITYKIDDGMVYLYRDGQMYNEESVDYSEIKRTTEWDGLNLIIKDGSTNITLERQWTGAFLTKMVICIAVFVLLLIYFVILLLSKKKETKTAPVGTYSGTTGSLTVSSASEETLIDVSSDASDSCESVSETSPETEIKNDIDTCNTIDEFEAAGGTPSLATECALVTSPADEEKKDRDNEWFTVAGDL